MTRPAEEYVCRACGKTMKSWQDFEEYQHVDCGGLVRLRAEIERDRAVVAACAAEFERDAYRSMLADLLASAHPHPIEHPTMTRQWNRARELLKNGPRETETP